jgi:hypothetical protein
VNVVVRRAPDGEMHLEEHPLPPIPEEIRKVLEEKD